MAAAGPGYKGNTPAPEPLMDIASYRRVLDPIVRPQDFKTNPGVLGHVGAHLALIGGAWALVAGQAGPLHPALVPLLAAFAGHSAAVLAIAAHEIGHGSVVRQPGLRYASELIASAGLLYLCPTIQGRSHNLRHHGGLNSPCDTDRRYTLAEAQADPDFLRDAPVLFPNARARWWVCVPLFHVAMMGHQLHLVTHTLGAKGTRFDVGLSPTLRRRLQLELAFNLSLYLALFAAAGFTWQAWLFLWGMYAVGITIAGVYTSTQHYFTPQGDRPDQVAQTCDLRLPAWLDWLHLRVSQHAAHHLYPTAGPAHFPAITRAIAAQFPTRYHVLSPAEAVRELFRTPLVQGDAETLVHVDGSGAESVRFPWPAADAEPNPAAAAGAAGD